MKKEYKTPECTMYAMPAKQLLQSSIQMSNKTTNNANNIGWSKGYSGGVEDDSSLNLWAEGE